MEEGSWQASHLDDDARAAAAAVSNDDRSPMNNYMQSGNIKKTGREFSRSIRISAFSGFYAKILFSEI